MKLLRNDIYENLRMAISTLLANKLRSFLTVFGVVIGVITVMLIASIISGIDVSVKKEIESFGTRSIFLSKYNPGIHIGRLSREERMRKQLTYDDAIALASLPTIDVSVQQRQRGSKRRCLSAIQCRPEAKAQRRGCVHYGGHRAGFDEQRQGPGK